MVVIFDKYQGCGNDFVMINNLDLKYGEYLENEIVSDLCNRRYGIGADGLILLNPSQRLDFRMVYYNADGNESSMCGNGGRCLVAFAKSQGLIKDQCRFEAIDGDHYADIGSNDIVRLEMVDVNSIEQIQDTYILDTGSPHLIKLVHDIEDYPVYDEGNKIRNSSRFINDGINVNFVQATDNGYRIRTYERGVEAETDACGTGVTAAALVLMAYYGAGSKVSLETNGGLLSVVVGTRENNTFKQVFLVGPAVKVFSGVVERNN